MIPDYETLFNFGNIYGGDRRLTPDGKDYWRFLVITYKDITYVAEQHVQTRHDGYGFSKVVKRLH